MDSPDEQLLKVLLPKMGASVSLLPGAGLGNLPKHLLGHQVLQFLITTIRQPAREWGGAAPLPFDPAKGGNQP